MGGTPGEPGRHLQMAGEPAHEDQVLRRRQYEAAHPDVHIACPGPYWLAVVPQAGGCTEVTAVFLQQLLDRLEALP